MSEREPADGPSAGSAAGGPGPADPASADPAPVAGDRRAATDGDAPAAPADAAAPAGDDAALADTARAEEADATATADAEPADADTPSEDAVGAPSEDAGADAGRGRRLRRGSRRYPTVTRDTAPPEGGRRFADGDSPAPIRQWPLLSVIAVLFSGLLVMLADFRIGLLIVGAAMLAGAVLRFTVPAVGMLAVRSRWTDVITYGGMGVVIVLLTMMAQPRPWLEVPFLNDILRFSAGS
ncbi:DUF3017 domain-containing protein [Streptomyces lonarensis]|uniref:DUF3017 domain-containing protein n=1 Tax=Streptomyces lonarensis TaxID=700599 RepID=A0A7X6D278_9ACTN|nr:DUF3017 domain-containing protein [Streptomyces lonarensis]NJQ06668.1 DUF3017 domain-containing protein [Streptomyces lonarensis]